ncbi:MAG TPA: LON peptidase substrate-binding domain-containing protein, partial [Planctomycetota bacterium]|nr:LON peptidase substrate-binding domain-containing protein [Planctomycetota bacterium]
MRKDDPNDGGGLPPDADDPGNEAPGKGNQALVVESPPGGKQSMVVQEQLPETMFVFPLRRAVPFPNLMMPLLLDTQEARDIIAKAEAHNGHVFLVLLRNSETEHPGASDLHEVGVVTRILKTIKLPDGKMSAMTQGLRRARIHKLVRQKPHLVARIKEVVEIPPNGKKAQSLFRVLQQNLSRLGELNEQGDQGFATTVLNLDAPGQLADFTGSVLRDLAQRQRILDAADVEQRLELAVTVVLQELELAELDKKIQEEIRSKAEKAQKDYFLREQLKLIRRELGEEKDPRSQEQQRLEQAIVKAGMPELARQRAAEELLRLKTTPVESAEYGVIRNYLDWLTALPWSVATTDDQDLTHAGQILDEDHYGLSEIKDRIL